MIQSTDKGLLHSSMRAFPLVCCLVGLVSLSPATYAADQIIRLAECPVLTAERLHELAVAALIKKKYHIEENTPTMLVGEFKGLKVEIHIESADQVVVRWKEGFGHKRDTWLRGLKTDILWGLAE